MKTPVNPLGLERLPLMIAMQKADADGFTTFALALKDVYLKAFPNDTLETQGHGCGQARVGTSESTTGADASSEGSA